ncbi:1009_t:CDS:2 [Funneliformis mosseae]|uniref:1009_t:CDS:1 n=1 Tax=Funneliformis mosseae TaxID=27381 RepID=A0A9N8Z6K1_FUNMO|nr:1009_t:CDS:2 [Funneliformis mosseae]
MISSSSKKLSEVSEVFKNVSKSVLSKTEKFKSLKSIAKNEIFASRTSKFFQYRLNSKEVPNVPNVPDIPDNKINLPAILPEVDVKIQKVQHSIDDKEKSSTKNIPSQEEVAILFLQELLQDFENILTNTEDFKGFDKYATDWMRNYIEENMKRIKVEYIFEVLLKFYQDNHLEYFSSLLGFFYQYGIGHKVNNKKALELYKITTKQDNLGKNIYNHLQNINKSVGEYLLALYYYKDIIVDRQKSLKWSYQPAKEGNAASQYEIGYCYEYGIGTIQSVIPKWIILGPSDQLFVSPLHKASSRGHALLLLLVNWFPVRTGKLKALNNEFVRFNIAVCTVFFGVTVPRSISYPS